MSTILSSCFGGSVWIVALFLVIPRIDAADLDPLQSIQGIFQDIRSCQISSVTSYDPTSAFYKLTEEKEGTLKETMRCDYWAENSNWRYEYGPLKEGSFDKRTIHAFNGSHNQYFTASDGGVLRIASTAKAPLAPIANGLLSWVNRAFEPLMFLFPEEQNQKPLVFHQVPDLLMIRASPFRGQGVKNEHSQSYKVHHSNPSIEVLVQAGNEPSTGSPTAYRLSGFGQEFFWPTYVEKIRNDRVIAEISIKKFASLSLGGKEWKWPVEVVTRHFDESGLLLMTTATIVSSVNLNEVIDEDIFTLDPSIASKINDLDTGTWVQVPR
jgi:hypothetical protein